MGGGVVVECVGVEGVYGEGGGELPEGVVCDTKRGGLGGFLGF